jgi:hypothetical protein
MRAALRLLLLVVCTCIAAPSAAGAPRPGVVEGPRDAVDLDLADLVPRAGRLDHVWFVPRGRTVPQVVVAWHFHGRTIRAWPDTRRYVVTLWNPERVTPATARWVPHTLIHASPFPLSGRSVRLADVTGDGHADLLVTIFCSTCNHSAAVVAVYASFGTRVRRIYGGNGYLGVAKGTRPDAGVRGRSITETWWGARNGLLWFDEPRGGTSVCCPAFRLQTFMRWQAGRGWRTVERRRVRPAADTLIRRPPP